MTALFFSLLKVSVHSTGCISYVPSSQDWVQLYEMAAKHALLGVCFNGVQNLYTHHPDYLVNLPIILKMQWVGVAASIQERNKLMNLRCKELQQRLIDVGLSACVLKGQGVATYYKTNQDGVSLADLRQSGDIDMWIKGGYDVVCYYVQQTHPSKDVSYHRFHYNIFNDVEVELHHRPSMMNNPFHNRKLQKWADEFSPNQFLKVRDLGFYVPSSAFNKLFLLCHIYRHFISEGVGLRQLMDYYFVLLNSSTDENAEVLERILQLGMNKFASAVMWVLREIFMLDEKYMLCAPNDREGRYLLREIMMAGNFGHHDKRYSHSGRFAMQAQSIRHSIHIVLHYPSEVLWMPIWLIWHFFWKLNKKRLIRLHEQ